MRNLIKHLKTGEFARVYLFTGDEPYRIAQALQLLKDKLVREGDDMNYTEYASPNPDLDQIKDFAWSFPFFSDKRMIVLKGTNILKTGPDEFLEIMKELPETTCMVICEESVDKKRKGYKWIQKNGYVAEFLKKNLTEKELIRFVVMILKKNEKMIRESDAAYLVGRIGPDLFLLKNETEKLVSYVGDEQEVKHEDIDASLSVEVEDRIYDMVRMVSGKNRNKVLEIYNDLILLKESPLRILALLMNEYRTLLKVEDMKRSYRPNDEIARIAKIPRFAIRRYESLLAGYTEAEVLQCISHCVDMETQIKTGGIGARIGVETMLIELTDRKKA